MTNTSRHPDARLARERDFHNQRFADGDNRAAQLKYYFAVEHGADRYLARVRDLARGADVLEYGCGDAEHFRQLAPIARHLTAIDISDTAIARLQASSPFGNASFRVMDAMQLALADGSMDLVFGSGIVHHLDTERSAREVARVLRPGGHAVFWEPLGLNPLINAYRLLTPAARTPDEHPLRPRDFAIFRRHFDQVKLSYFGLASIVAVPFRDRAFGRPLRRVLRGLDDALLRLPGLRQIGWYCLMECRR